MPWTQEAEPRSGDGKLAGTARYSRRTCGKVESRLPHRSWLETMSSLARQTVTSMPWTQPRERVCGNAISKSPWLRPQPFPVTGFGLEAATGLFTLSPHLEQIAVSDVPVSLMIDVIKGAEAFNRSLNVARFDYGGKYSSRGSNYPECMKIFRASRGSSVV